MRERKGREKEKVHPTVREGYWSRSDGMQVMRQTNPNPTVLLNPNPTVPLNPNPVGIEMKILEMVGWNRSTHPFVLFYTQQKNWGIDDDDDDDDDDIIICPSSLISYLSIKTPLPFPLFIYFLIPLFYHLLFNIHFSLVEMSLRDW